MLEANLYKVLGQIKPDDRVLDVGGWARPLRRANYVVDVGSYATRGIFGGEGPGPERFTDSTWIVHDICGQDPFPFADKYFDYAVCSHTLEDVRDPIRVCRELMRVSKRGYIEVPSRRHEMTKGVEHPRYAGRYHHRWLIDIGERSIAFTFKYHNLHSSWRYHFPRRILKILAPADEVQWLFWDGEFDVCERIMFHENEIDEYLAGFVRSHSTYSNARYALDQALHRLRSSLRSAIGRSVT